MVIILEGDRCCGGNAGVGGSAVPDDKRRKVVQVALEQRLDLMEARRQSWGVPEGWV